MKFDVTEMHFRRGYRCSSQFCPVALAGREALGLQVFVTHEEIKAGADRWFVDSILRDRLRAIDGGELPLRPFTVELTGVMATVVSEDPAYAS